jgi:hypothetical protein
MKSNGRVLTALLTLSLACAVMTVMTTPAAAAVVDLGGGWKASWPVSLDGLVSMTGELVDDVLIVRKTVKFTQPPVNGIFPTIPIVFTQNAVLAAMHIVIDNESIQNSTGVDWRDFHIDLLGGGTVFDSVSTANSGGPPPIGWDIAPFAQAAFTANLKRLDIWDGIVPAGQSWLPGGALAGGRLWLDVFPNPNAFTSFSLKETPTPEPATVCLLAFGGVALLTKRGRRVAG